MSYGRRQPRCTWHGELCRSDPEGRQAWRPADRAPDEDYARLIVNSTGRRLGATIPQAVSARQTRSSSMMIAVVLIDDVK